MANIIITCDVASITFDYGDYATNGGVPYKKGSYDKSSVKSIEMAADESYIKFNNQYLSWEAGNYQVVDSVQGVAPTSQSHLYDLLVGCKSMEN